MPLALDDSVEREQRVAVGEVMVASSSQAKVALGLNERARVGDRARPTRARPTADKVAPPRAAGLWDVGFLVRPFLPLDTLGLGVLGHAWAGYRFEEFWHVQARFSPAGLAIGEGPDVTTGVVTFMGSFDVRLLEIGLGFGGQTVNAPDAGLRGGTGLTISQLLRIGAEDGLYLRVQTDIVLFHSDFLFSGATAWGQIPVAHGVWLLANGGGGNSGHAFGELGVRVLTRGNGGAGSFFLSATVGGAALFEDWMDCEGASGFGGCDEEVDQTLAGPSLGIGAEWRL